MNKNYLLIIALLTLTFSCNNDKVDLIVINSKIYTVNQDNFIAKSIAVKNGKIIDVSDKNLTKFYKSKEIYNANGKTILPGLIDSHCHFYNLGLDQQVVNLRETK